LIQNADDAEASKVVIILDMRDFSKNTTKLLNAEMSMLQVPSIICYNNATFQEKDFKLLKNLGASRKENEPTKTGRFGIGFNFVYVSDSISLTKHSTLLIFCNLFQENTC
jgi:hypothetical protein